MAFLPFDPWQIDHQAPADSPRLCSRPSRMSASRRSAGSRRRAPWWWQDDCVRVDVNAMGVDENGCLGIFLFLPWRGEKMSFYKQQLGQPVWRGHRDGVPLPFCLAGARFSKVVELIRWMACERANQIMRRELRTTRRVEKLVASRCSSRIGRTHACTL